MKSEIIGQVGLSIMFLVALYTCYTKADKSAKKNDVSRTIYWIGAAIANIIVLVGINIMFILDRIIQLIK